MLKLVKLFTGALASIVLALGALVNITMQTAYAVPPPFAGGDGSESTPYLISTCTQLQAIDDVDGTDNMFFKLTGDIDCSETSTWNDNGSGGFYGFKPIGSWYDWFSGSFDGAGHTISGLYINRGDDSRVGLFNRFNGTSMHIHDVTISGANITGSSTVGILVGDSSNVAISDIEVSGDVYSGSHSAGGVAGYFSGGTAQNIVSKANVTGGTDAVGGFAGSSGCGAVISDSYATGTITGGSYVGGFSGSDGCEGPGSTMTRVWATGNVVATGGSVGGLIGSAGLTTITEAYATGAVTAGADNVGGLVGYLSNSSSITRSFSSSATNAAVSSPSSNIVGGLVGYVDTSTVTDSYARRNVTGSDQVAGLVGYALNATITNTYATGALTGLHFPINGLIIADSTSVVDSFWDKDTTGTTTNYGAIGLTTALMQTPSTFTDAGWNSTTVWSLVNGAYPCLRWSNVSCADDDGVDVETEAAAPNSGDANNDGTLDSQQSNVTSVLSPTSNKYVTLESTCSSNYNVQIGGQAAGSPDGSYSYPAGLIGFVLKGCTVGGTATITQYYYGTYDLSKISMRKWQDNTYKTVPGAVFTSVTIGGQPAVKVVYQITDGSSLDDDGIADGNIVDPAGMAVLAATTTTVSAPNTGIEPQSAVKSIILIATSLMLFLGIYGKTRDRASSK